MKIGVVGVGYLGKIHLKCLKETPFEIVGVYDIDKSLSDSVSNTFNIPSFNSIESLFEVVEAVCIITDTSAHFQVAKKALEAGKHVFIEKPITSSYEEALDLKIIKSKRPELKLQVGHIERYNPAFLDLKDFELNPQFVEIHRLSTFNQRGTDVSVVMDLMIHDLDVLTSIIPHEVIDIQAKGVRLFSKTADICNARLEFSNNCVVNITASRISLKSMRKMRIFQPDAYVNIDFLKKQSQIINLSDVPFNEGESMQFDTSEGTKYMSIKTNDKKDLNSIVLELKDFYDSIVHNKTESIGIEDAVSVMKLAHLIELKINEDK